MNLKKNKTTWPTKAAMEQVYEMKLWGANASKFYSGTGSHHSEIIEPYIKELRSFLSSFESPLTVCDLGCGDFNVGKELVPYAKKYVAVDIVAPLITYNKAVFKAPTLTFHCLDIAVDNLPSGDCALVRQVLQHLSNSEIQAILGKLRAYKYVVITEHLPKTPFTPNKEIISGQGTRLKKQSGVLVEAAPFSFKYTSKKELLSVANPTGKGLLVTTHYQLF